MIFEADQISFKSLTVSTIRCNRHGGSPIFASKKAPSRRRAFTPAATTASAGRGRRSRVKESETATLGERALVIYQLVRRGLSAEWLLERPATGVVPRLAVKSQASKLAEGAQPSTPGRI